MIKRISLFVILAVLTISTYSQKNPRIKRKNFFLQETGFQDAWKAVKQGNKNYINGKGSYRLALEKYWIANEYNDANAALNYKIGICYLYTGKDKVKALEHLKKAYKIDQYIANDISFFLARAYHLNLDFENAIKEYNNFKSQFTAKQFLKININIDKYIQECKNGMELVQMPKRVIIQNLGKGVNSPDDEYNSIFNQDITKMFYTSRRNITVKKRKSPDDNKFFEDIYTSNYNNETWSPSVQLPDKKINTKSNDGAVALGGNGTNLYIYRGSKRGGDIKMSINKDGKWKKAKLISRKICSNKQETTLFISPDQKTMFFISKREEENVGGKDIYVSHPNEKGKWMEPVNLGPKVNSPFDEEGLSYSKYGDTLYFGSKGFNSMGGFDIFKTYKDADGNWTDPVNLGYPVNTPDDEMFYKITDNPKIAYYSTTRDDGFGGIDLYKIIYLGAEKELVMNNEDDPLVWYKKPVPDLFYRVPEKLIIDTSLFMIGKILDNSSSEPVVAKLNLIDMDKSQVIGTTISDEKGSYKVMIPVKKNYGVEINAAGYMFFVDTVNLAKDQFKNDVAIRDFKLDKVEVGAKMILKNIYFDTGKSTLKPESYPELARVVKFLENNPTIRIEISGHTDNIGAASYNKKLSKERAKSVVEYLVGNGVKQGRLEFEGYGFEQPIASNAKEETRSLNRRVEFKILSVK